MPKCQRCRKRFDLEEARDEFESEYSVSYDNLTEVLCGDCAISAYEDADGAYFETCECCGKKFEPMEEEGIFSSRIDDCGADINMFGEILCAECAEEKYYQEIDNDSEENY